MGKKAPKAPDPSQTAAKQYAYSKKAAEDQLKLNALDRSGPFGESVFEKNDAGLPTGVNTSLSETLQAGADNVSAAYGDMSSILPTEAFDSTAVAPDASHISQTFYDKGLGLLKPRFDQAQRDQEIRLAERGIPIASEIWNTETGNLDREQNLALSDLAMSAVLQAPREEQRHIDNARMDYTMPSSQLSSYASNLGLLKGLTPNAPQPSASLSTPNYAQLAQNKYQADMDRYNNQMSGLGQLFGTGAKIISGGLFG